MSKWKDMVESYDEAATKYPIVKAGLDLAPGTGTATALADTAANLTHGNYGTAALDALGAVPLVGSGVKLARGVRTFSKLPSPAAIEKTSDAADKTAKGRSIILASENLPELTRDAVPAYRTISPLRRGSTMKNGGSVKTYVKGGSIRGGGIEQRGKTKGRFV